MRRLLKKKKKKSKGASCSVIATFKKINLYFYPHHHRHHNRHHLHKHVSGKLYVILISWVNGREGMSRKGGWGGMRAGGRVGGGGRGGEGRAGDPLVLIME